MKKKTKLELKKETIEKDLEMETIEWAFLIIIGIIMLTPWAIILITQIKDRLTAEM